MLKSIFASLEGHLQGPTIRLFQFGGGRWLRQHSRKQSHPKDALPHLQPWAIPGLRPDIRVLISYPIMSTDEISSAQAVLTL